MSQIRSIQTNDLDRQAELIARAVAIALENPKNMSDRVLSMPLAWVNTDQICHGLYKSDVGFKIASNLCRYYQITLFDPGVFYGRGGLYFEVLSVSTSERLHAEVPANRGTPVYETTIERAGKRAGFRLRKEAIAGILVLYKATQPERYVLKLLELDKSEDRAQMLQRIRMHGSPGWTVVQEFHFRNVDEYTEVQEAANALKAAKEAEGVWLEAQEEHASVLNRPPLS